MKKSWEGGNVTLFAFAQNEGLSEHTMPHDALVVMLDGEAEIEIDSVPYTLGAGKMITLPPNVPHAVRACRPSRCCS